MELGSDDDEPTPVCDLCGLDLEFMATEVNGHQAVALTCLVHGQRRLWTPFVED